MSWGSFITTLNTDKNRKSEKESAERHRVMHMEVPLLTSTAIASFHIHSEFISSWAIQVALPLPRRWIQRLSASPAIFLRSQWNCSAVAQRWIVPRASQTVLRLSLHQWVSLHPGRGLTQTSVCRWENFPTPTLSPMFSFQQSKQAWSLNLAEFISEWYRALQWHTLGLRGENTAGARWLVGVVQVCKLREEIKLEI